MNKNYFKWLIASTFLLPLLLFAFGTSVVYPLLGSGGFVSLFYTLSSVLVYFITLAYLLAGTYQPNVIALHEVTLDSPVPKKLKNAFYVLLFLTLSSSLVGVYKKAVFINNTSITYTKTLDQQTQNVGTIYDEYWKSAQQQLGLADTVKNVFVKVVSIQMTARTPSASASWNWVQENTQIDHETYLKLYAKVSEFIAAKRDEIQKLEEDRQITVRDHNILLDTFPNRVYNIFLGRDALTYKPVISSDSTNNVLKSGIENLK